MKKEKAPKPPKIKKIKQKKKISFNNIFFLLLSLTLTICLFFGLVILENRLSGKVIYTSVVVAKNDIDKNIVITEDAIDKYFRKQDIVQSDAVDGMLYDTSSLVGMKTAIPLKKGEPVFLKDFENLNAKIAHIKNPVQVAINTGNLADIAGGILREGDNINIIITNTAKSSQNGYVSSYVMENAYVSAAMNSSGTKLAGDDKTSSATMLLLIIEKDDELILSDALVNSRTIRISKILY